MEIRVGLEIRAFSEEGDLQTIRIAGQDVVA